MAVVKTNQPFFMANSFKLPCDAPLQVIISEDGWPTGYCMGVDGGSDIPWILFHSLFQFRKWGCILIDTNEDP